MNDATVERAVRARLDARPGDRSIAQLVLLDHHMVPTRGDVDRWVADAGRRRFRTLRTSALFPVSQPAFLDAGFTPIDRLTLLELDLRGAGGRKRRQGGTRRLRTRDLPDAAAVDTAAFGDDAGIDPEALGRIGEATPYHRSRAIGRRSVIAFAISGRAARTGYIQRLAVHPDRQGSGLGRILVDDALAWMVRHGVATVLVNTGIDNAPALRLYTSEGFCVRPDELAVLERPLTA